MFSFFSSPEIAEELIKTQIISDDVNDYSTSEDISSDDFLAYEENTRAVFRHIDYYKLTFEYSTYFYDIEETMNSSLIAARLGEHFSSSRRDGKSFSLLSKYFSKLEDKLLLFYQKFTSFLTFSENESGLEAFSKIDVKSSEIKFIEVNSFGQICAIVTKRNMLILLNLSKGTWKFYNPRILQGSEDKNIVGNSVSESAIVCLRWHPVKNTLSLGYSNRLMMFGVSENMELYLHREIYYDGLVTFKWDPSGLTSAILSRGGKRYLILDANMNEISSKSQVTRTYKDIVFAGNSSYFVLYTEKDLFIVNMHNLSFKSYSYFEGNIKSVLISDNSFYIFVFADSLYNPIYIIYNLTEDFYNISSYSSYHNPSAMYTHDQFKLYYKIFALANGENLEIVKTMRTCSDTRLVIFYRKKEQETAISTSVKVYEVTQTKSVHDLAIKLLFTINNFRGMQITNCELFYDYFNSQEVLLIIWDGKILSKTIINHKGQ